MSFTRTRPVALVAAAAAALAGCGAGDRQSTSATSAPVQPAGSAQAAARQPRIPAGRMLRIYSGTGTKTIGSLTRPRATVLEWSAARPPIQVSLSNGFVLVSSSSPSGRTRILRGRYPGVKVATSGRWTIRLRAVR